MKLIGRNVLDDFKKKHADAKNKTNSLEAEIDDAEWETPHDVKSKYPYASIIGNGNVVFDVCNNKYRIWTIINYLHKIVLVKKAGTHDEYNKWDIK